MNQTSLSMRDLREVVSRFPDNALSANRLAAIARLDRTGLPTTSNEDWKYTSLDSAVDISNQWFSTKSKAGASDSQDAMIASLTASIDADWLLIVDGKLELDQFQSPRGIEVERYSETTGPALSERPLQNLNVALMQDGIRIQVNAATEKPIGILVIDESNGTARMSQANVEIEIAAGCDAEIIEYQTSMGDGEHFANSVISMQVGEAANASYLRLQNRGQNHVQTGHLSVSMHKDSKLTMASFDLGGRLIRNDVEIDIAAPGVQVSFDGLYLAGDGQHIDNHTRVDHRVGPANSSQEYRGILNGSCRCVWNGKAIVHEGADGTDANQANHNLLLSPQAEIDAKPELEIYADDVKCSHGTTIGQLDEAALYYLRTRGIDAELATQFLVRAFATDLLSRTPIEASKTATSELVETRLRNLILAETS